MLFPTTYEEIIERIERFSPVKYGATRNYIDGNVSYLSPYISRGVISTKYVFELMMKKGYDFYHIEKFIQELAWRDYWQLIWIEKNDQINKDLKRAQENVAHYGIPKNIVTPNSGIHALDKGVEELYNTGYMHNHMRMYIAMVTCNISQSHWWLPAKWMYYHLLDGDWASNALSWQWVAGANANKKYFANQSNINKYTHSDQLNTYLDTTYDHLNEIEIPQSLKESQSLELHTELPDSDEIIIDQSLPTLIYNSYQLDPKWNNHISANRILLLEPSHFNEYPISNKVMDFILNLSKNIQGIQIFVGEFRELKPLLGESTVYYKEHPLANLYEGVEEQREWISSVKGYHTSFFKFWKKVRKEMQVLV
ncbi:FAD-binding domain-containing protein [Flammeovirga agarivorans]|uniref:Deoxyribodipyrimidine photolyase n=1 Tax=Flammeovirga agarivorans TaxID=2726742 RepID=A0A7X8SJ47_9BACT|nr:FAD-binding domain-containing protein [Flammeovirga agarivorans]NLR91198.1 deoxyribodipyrimidine photolyase [Flammeovirga agarivorans]